MSTLHLTACIAATALFGGVAIAQTTQPVPQSPPSAGAPTVQAPSSTSSPAATSGQFVTEQSPNHWRASKLVGVDVYGADNQKVGDINEVLVDKNGNAEAVVIGVGGFLGIGEKNIAVLFKALEWTSEPRPTASSGAPGATAPAPTGSTGTGARTDSATTEASRGYPDRAILRMTKADLQNAPTFRYAGDTRSTRTAPPNTSPPANTTAPGTAPRQ